MKMLPLLQLLAPELAPEKTKVHLASYNGRDKPLDVYRAGKFQEWQTWQNRKCFERKFVVSLIQMDEAHRWLFAGAFTAHGCKQEYGSLRYSLKEIEACKELDGRIVARFERPGRNSYLVAERWVDEIAVAEIRAEKLTLRDFPGFKGLCVTKAELDLVVRENHSAWRAALSSVAGVYLITDSKSGKFYVGSATGKGGLWQRWCDYSSSGHGGNRDLKALLGADPVKRAAEFQFSVLEIADTHASEDEVRVRETHWKQVLLTRIHGLNRN